ncbi:hypothetical protein PsorP6_005104 [Peronosclerospora sorghi]|uniref:Uncharacterized protein n=1 Tax=Peronosclerospora sorghi TaxID=230839 RepID=A0ACC0W2N2_9STRA|nr:hypothetical protein PsorP6_005104 [Peronosclerospora sorghi]
MEESGELDDDDKDHTRSMRIKGDTSDEVESEEDKDRKSGRRSSGNGDDSADVRKTNFPLGVAGTTGKLYGSPFQPFPPPGQQYPPGYAASGSYRPPNPPMGSHSAPNVFVPPPEQAQAYYAAQGRNLFVQATMATSRRYAPLPHPAYPPVTGGTG